MGEWDDRLRPTEVQERERERYYGRVGRAGTGKKRRKREEESG